MNGPARRTGARRVPAGIALLAIVALLAPCAAEASEGDELVALARRGDRVLIAEFGLGMCRQCKTQSEILDRVRSAYKNKVIVRMVHVNREHDLTARYRVETIPHLVFFDRSGSVVLRRTGVMSFEDISAQLGRMGVTQ